MNFIFEVLYHLLPYLHILAGIAMIFKMVMVFRNKGFDFPAYVISFFRVYTQSDKSMTNSISRKQYMKLNNLINFYLYSWAFITFIIFLVFHDISGEF